MHSLPVFLRLAGRPVVLLGDGEAAEAKRRLIVRAGGVPVGEDAPNAALAVVALTDEGEAEAAVARLRARGLLVNAVDRPALCDFTWPAMIDRDPLIVAIGTGGAAAGLAKMVRQRIEALLPSGIGTLAAALGAARPALRRRFPQPDDRRRALDAALAAGGALDPLVPQPADTVDRWLGAPDARPADGLVTIRLRSADPDDLTLREARWLASADRVHHDPSVPAAILDRARADAARIAGPAPADPGPGLTIDVRNTEA